MDSTDPADHTTNVNETALLGQVNEHLRSHTALQRRHEDQRAQAAAAQLQQWSTLAQEHATATRQLLLTQAAEQQTFWEQVSTLQKRVHDDLDAKWHQLQQV